MLGGTETQHLRQLVVDVGRPQHLAGQALQQPGLLVGAVGRAQHADHLALLVLEGGDDQRGAGHGEQLVLGADEDVHPLAALGEP